MTWLLVAGMTVILVGEVAVIYTFHRWHTWEKLTLIPWLNSLSRFINPDKK